MFSFYCKYFHKLGFFFQQSEFEEKKTNPEEEKKTDPIRKITISKLILYK